MKKPNLRKLQAEVDGWNASNGVGAEVVVRKDDGSTVRTRTRSAAEVLSGHSAVVWLEDVRGCHALSHVTAIEA
jgi:hypothetical protein